MRCLYLKAAVSWLLVSLITPAEAELVLANIASAVPRAGLWPQLFQSEPITTVLLNHPQHYCRC